MAKYCFFVLMKKPPYAKIKLRKKNFALSGAGVERASDVWHLKLFLPQYSSINMLMCSMFCGWDEVIALKHMHLHMQPESRIYFFGGATASRPCATSLQAHASTR